MLGVLGEVCECTGWQVHAWVLMGNHYHFVVHTPEANRVAGMKLEEKAFGIGWWMASRKG